MAIMKEILSHSDIQNPSEALTRLYQLMGIEKVVNMENENAVLCSPHKTAIPVEFGIRKAYNPERSMRSVVRVNNLILADDESCQSVEKKGCLLIPGFHLLRMRSPLPYSSIGRGYITHFAATAAAVLDSEKEIIGKTVLDLGAGEAPLSMTALIKGAKFAIMIEKDPLCASNAQLNMRLNSLENKGRIFNEDIGFLSESCQRSLDKTEILIANIGPHEIYGGQEGAHLSAVSILGYLPLVQTLILGGYGPDGSDLGPEKIIKALSRKGFEVASRYQIREINGERTGAQALVFNKK